MFESTTMRHQVDFLIIDPDKQDFATYLKKYNSFAKAAGLRVDEISDDEDDAN
jgi:hypothetical protein